MAPPTHTDHDHHDDEDENVRGDVSSEDLKGLVPVAAGVEWAQPWMAVFLEAYGRGANATMAYRAAGVSRAELYRAAEADPVFGEAWRQAREAIIDAVEGRLIGDALKGNTVAQIFFLKNNRTSVYSERLELRGSVDATVTHQVAVLDGAEPREVSAVARHEAAALLRAARGLAAGTVVEGAEALPEAPSDV